jgi:hypothetical protein
MKAARTMSETLRLKVSLSCMVVLAELGCFCGCLFFVGVGGGVSSAIGVRNVLCQHPQKVLVG